MDIDNIKIGIDATIYPPITMGFNFVKQYEQMGYESLWFEDHWMGLIPETIWKKDIINVASLYDNPNLYYDPLVVMGAVANITKKTRLGVCVTDTFRNHPATLARSFITLDHISKGRTILGLGAGEKENIIPYGIKWERAITRLKESIEIIRLFWDKNKKVNYKGEIWNLKDAIIGLKPKKECPPIWIASHGPKMLKLTGELGDGWLPFLPSCSGTELYKERLKIIINSAKKASRELEKFTPSLYATLIVDEEHEECHEMMNNLFIKINVLLQPNETFKKYGLTHPFGENFNGLVDFIPTKYSKEEIMKALDKITPKMCEDTIIHGTPDDIILKIEQYAKVGLKHIVLLNLTPFCDLKKMKIANEHLGEIIKFFKQKK